MINKYYRLVVVYGRHLTKFFSLVLILFLSANTIFADVKDEKEIQKVISQQISSFQADDIENAFTFASQSIKDISHKLDLNQS